MAQDQSSGYVFPDAGAVWTHPSSLALLLLGAFPATVAYMGGYAFFVLPKMRKLFPGEVGGAGTALFILCFLVPGFVLALCMSCLAYYRMPLAWRRVARKWALRGHAGLLLLMPRFSGEFVGYSVSVDMSRRFSVEPSSHSIRVSKRHPSTEYETHFDCQFELEWPRGLELRQKTQADSGAVIAFDNTELDRRIAVYAEDAVSARHLVQTSVFRMRCSLRRTSSAP